MNEELKRALMELRRNTSVFSIFSGNVKAEDAALEGYWETLWPAIERWHEGEVGRLTWERDGARGDRDTALGDNQRLREQLGALQAKHDALMEGVYAGLDMVEDAMSRSRPAQAHADPHPEVPSPMPKAAPVMPVCTRCEHIIKAGNIVVNRVQPDGTIGREHVYCPSPDALFTVK